MRNIRINIKSRRMKKIVTLALLICVISVILLSEVFILTHANHEHDHNGAGGACTTCVQIQNAENLLKQLGTALGGVSFMLAGLFIVIAALCLLSFLTEPSTLIKMKIRMNN